MGVREGTDAMATRPQHALQMSYEADLVPFRVPTRHRVL